MSKYDTITTNACIYRFPLKDPIMLEKWENAVMKINNKGQVWRATRYSFEHLDYIVPPTTAKETCRLKKCSTISIFNIGYT
jgi:hypothetical protein